MAVLRLVVDRRAPLDDLLQASASKISPGRAARQTSSASVSAARPSPSAMRASARARRRRAAAACPDLFRSRQAVSRSPRIERLKTSTRARDSSGAFSSKDGFSVVAPTSTMVPSSITGRKLSCWARLKRWISSTNSSVPCPISRRARASSKTFFSSATPEKIAEICSNCSLGLVRQQPRDRGLAGAGRTPEDHRAERAACPACGSARRPARADDPGRRLRQAFAAAACRPAGAARRVRGRPLRTDSDRRPFGARAHHASALKRIGPWRLIRRTRLKSAGRRAGW